VPLVLRGAAPATSADPTRAPRVDPRWLDDVHALLDRDPVLGPALAAGIETEALLAPLRPPAAPRDRTRGDRDGDGDGDREREGDGDGAAVLGRMLAADGGPRIAVVERGGWDTHTAQDRTLTQGLDGLARSIAGLRDGLGDRWADTVVVAATEFGRTVRGNGTGGTDHGTGGVALLAGGAVAGGRVVADWPGLDDGALLDGRDLRPTTDLRRVFAGILRDHLRVPERALRGVFPGGVAPLDGLVRVG
ncbi:MAG: DUF1501 domain-containing protein, partial [Myxococcota bacterium]